MKRTRRIAGAAWRKVLLREIVRASGPALTIGAGAGALGALSARLVWASSSATAWTALGIGVGAGLAAGVGVGWMRARRIGLAGAAIEVDRALGLRDRISSALTFGAGEDEAFVALAREDAERKSAGLRAGRAVRVRMGRWWGAWPVLAAAGVAIGIWVPAMTILDARAKEERLRLVALQEQREQAAEQVRETRELLSAEEEKTGGVTAEELRALEEIERELERGMAGGEEALAKAAAALEEMAQQREALERRAEEQIEEIASRVASSNSESSGGGGKAKELRDALARGDMDAAAEALKALEEPGALSEEEMLELAREMEAIADALEQTEGGEDSQGQDGAKSESSSQSAAQELSESLREAAKDVNEQCQGGGGSDGSKSGEKQQGESSGGESKEGRQKPSEAQGAPGGAHGQESSQKGREGGEGQTKEGGEESTRRDAQQGAQADANSPPGGERSQEPGGKTSSAQQGEAGEGAGEAAKGSPRGEAGEGENEGSSGQGKGVQRARETLERMAREQEGARGNAQKARDLRGAAKELMKGGGGEQREQGGGMAMEGRGEMGGGAGSQAGPIRTREPGKAPKMRTEEVDARRAGREEEGGARSFEWYNPNAKEGRGTVDGRVAAERLREAAESAERAIEDQTLPSRYSKLLREYYRRMPDAVRGEGSGETKGEGTKPSGG